MLVSEFIEQVNDAFRGTDDDAPTLGTEDADYWLRVANRIMRNLYRNTNYSWASCYQVLDLGVVSADATPTYNLSATFVNAAVKPYIIDTAGARHDYILAKPQETSTLRREAYIVGKNPQVLTFTTPIVTGELIIGGTLYLPGYFLPADMADEDDEVPVDDPDWLVVATAAKLAFNDLTYEDKYSELNGEANSLYKQMTAANRKGVYKEPRTTPTNVFRIPGTRRG